MAANHVTAPMEIADLIGVEESACADVVRRDKEVAGESVSLENVCRLDGGNTPVVKRDDESRLPILQFRESANLFFEPRDRYFVERGVTAGKAAAFVVLGRDEVVVHERRRMRRYALNHGCPQVAD